MPEERPVEPDIAAEIISFVQGIDALATSLPLVMIMMSAMRKGASKRYSDFLEEHGNKVNESDKVSQYSLLPEFHAEANRLKREYDNAKIGHTVLPRSFVVSLVSQFDAFLGRLLRALFLLKPEMLSASERQITLSELLELGTVQSAVEYILEKEVETVLRKSHTDQFAWMEHRFKITLTKDLKSWSTFVELTERRNLFVHTGGVVSSQYLASCKDRGVVLDANVKTGVQLEADEEYFDEAYRVIYEIGVKLAHVLWRKLRADQLEKSDRALGNLAFDLIVAERYDIARDLLEFACGTLKKYAKEKHRKIDLINLAQTYKWLGQPDRCDEILNGEDWSASGPDLALAVAVLHDDFAEAAKVMRQIGASGEITEHNYKEWPMFQMFRNTVDFAEAFEQVFGKPYLVLEEAPEETAALGSGDAEVESRPPDAG